jgi:hypothetical protein
MDQSASGFRRKRTFREIATELETADHVALTGKRYGAAAIARMIEN